MKENKAQPEQPPVDLPAATEPPAPAPVTPPAPVRKKYRYVGTPTSALLVPGLQGEINPQTIPDDRLEVLMDKFPNLKKVFKAI